MLSSTGRDDMPLTDWSDTILIAELGDEPLFSEEIDALIQRLRDDTRDVPDVILDMQAVTRLNSSNLGAMIQIRTLQQRAGKRLLVCSLNDTAWSVLLVTNLDRAFTFTEDVATALTSIQMGR